jgi:peptide-methionine (S)-S-oxide reductase
MKQTFYSLLISAFIIIGCDSSTGTQQMAYHKAVASNLDTATFGAGCFWCVEAVFQQLEGVDTVISGYSGGTVKNPSYEAVCSGNTGHAEVCQIYFDAQKITFEELCQVFYLTHNPTTLNKQGNDRGTQYRSAIFFHNEKQRISAEKIKAELADSKIFKDPIVTEISAYQEFFAAEDYHQNYYRENANSNMYCQAVIVPKLEKFKKTFHDKLKK